MHASFRGNEGIPILESMKNSVAMYQYKTSKTPTENRKEERTRGSMSLILVKCQFSLHLTFGYLIYSIKIDS